MPFSEQHASAACNFFEKILKHSADEWYGQPFLLCPWQEAALCQIFGQLDDSGNRIIEMVYIETPKKPLHVDTPIPTPSGWTTMGSIEPGDTVFDEAGRPSAVTGVSPIFHDRECFRVRFSDGETIIADADHPWLTTTKKPNRKTALRTTREIAKTVMYSRSRNHAVRLAEPLVLPDADLPLDPWLLGYWLGNGTRNCNVVTCGLEDLSAIEREIGKSGHKHCVRKDPRAAAIRLDPGEGVKCRPSPFMSKLQALGITGDKRIPQRYLRASASQRSALLQGLMDSDGDCAKRGGSCRFSTMCRVLCGDVYELLCSLGFQARVTKSRARLNGKDYGESYRIFFTAFEDQPVFRLERKLKRQRQKKNRIPRSSRRFIVSVEPVPSVPVRCITVDSPSHLFLAGKGMIPTHNSGKTEFAAGIVLLVLLLTNVKGCQVYGAASATRQAMNVYRAACKMVEQSPLLKKRLRVLRGTNRIVKRSDPDSFYAAIAADGDVGDGVNPACVIADELHRWKTRKQIENWDVLSNGGITRKQTLTIAITTAGVQNESPLAWRLHEKTRKVEAGIVSDPKFYGRIYGAAKEDNPADPATWIKANPSLKQNGGFLDIAKIREQYVSHAAEGDLTSFKRYFLNMWDQKESRAIDLVQWDASRSEWQAAGLLPLAPEDSIRPLPRDLLAHFIERRCWVGVDLSMSTDLSAVAFVFPCDDGGYDILPFFWTPAAKVKQRQLRDGMPYQKWAEEGLIELSPGTVIDYRDVRARIEWGVGMFDVQEICFDPWNSREMSVPMVEAGFPCIEVRQGFQTLSEPSKKLLELVASARLYHGAHPVLRWNASCLNAKWANDNLMFTKPDREKNSSRIDGISAAVNALHRALVMESKTITYSGLRSVG